MGWTGTSRQKGQTDKEFFEAEFPSIEFLVNGRNGSTVYAAARSKVNGEVFGLVILTQTSRGYWNFHYKEMDEAMGPNESRAPEKVLDLLDELAPLTPKPEAEGRYDAATHAAEWRARCRAYHVARKAVPKISKGDTIEIPEGRYQGIAGRFTVLDARRGLFANEYGSRYRLQGWRSAGWKKVA